MRITKLAAFAIATTLVLAGCGKRYESPLESPVMTKAPEDKEYDLDFVQMNNDVLEEMQDKGIYDFIEEMEVDGDNGTKQIRLNVKIKEDVLYDAVELMLTDATKAIISAAHTQDFRIDEYTDEDFGNLFNIFSYDYKVTCGDEVITDESLNAGDSVPFDPTLNIDNVIG